MERKGGGAMGALVSSRGSQMRVAVHWYTPIYHFPILLKIKRAGSEIISHASHLFVENNAL